MQLPLASLYRNTKQTNKQTNLKKPQENEAQNTHPSSRRDRLTCCNSDSRSPSTPLFFILSLPARSQLQQREAIKNASKIHYKVI